METSLVATSLFRRFVNYFFDRSLWVVLTFIFCVLVNWVLFRLGVQTNNFIILGGVIFAYGIYYCFAELKSGRTFGKYLTETQVVDMLGRQLTVSQILKRNLARFIPFNDFSILFTHDHRSWHDKISSTIVVSSKTLPIEQRPKHAGFIKIIAILLFLLLPGSVFVYQLTQIATGGERFSLPSNMPADLKLTEFKKIPNSHADYYTLLYTGSKRTIQINRLIAGFNFDPKELCNYMTPTPHELIYEPISKDLTCIKIASKNNISLYQITNITNKTDLQDITPDFYFEKPPYRYMIKATSGSLSREEIGLMLDSIVTLTEQDLQRQIDDTHN